MATGLMVEELSKVIAQATAPAFLLGAVAGFVSVLIGRLNRIADRTAALSAAEDSAGDGKYAADLTHLRRRAKLINRAIEYAVASGIFTTMLVIVAFVTAAVGWDQAYGAAVIFVLALGSFATSLIFLWREVRLSLHTLEQYL
jgi:Protein of unknown function (DUF2721)